MSKKPYLAPQMRVVQVQQTDFICMSFNAGTESVVGGDFDWGGSSTESLTERDFDWN